MLYLCMTSQRSSFILFQLLTCTFIFNIMYMYVMLHVIVIVLITIVEKLLGSFQSQPGQLRRNYRVNNGVFHFHANANLFIKHSKMQVAASDGHSAHFTIFMSSGNILTFLSDQGVSVQINIFFFFGWKWEDSSATLWVSMQCFKLKITGRC